MVTTRRQSGTVASKAAEKALNGEKDSTGSTFDDDQELTELSDEDGEEDVSENQDDDEDGDGDYGKARKTAKRQKVATPAKSKASGAGAKSTRRRKNDLSLLPSMPLDILFEIFGHMSPKDLLSVVRTNKLFRKTLLSPKATTVWKAAREALDGPAPPLDIGEVRWAALAYGHTCQSCGTKGIPNTDWSIFRRTCKFCKKIHLVQTNKFKTRFPDYQIDMLDYVLYTHAGPYTPTWHRDDPSRTKYYWDEDIHDLAEEYDTLSHAASFGKTEIIKAFDEWKEDRKKVLDTVKKMEPEYKKWKRSIEAQKENEAEDKTGKRLEAVKSRFRDLGFDSVDIDSAITASMSGISTGGSNVTNAVWTRLRQKLEPAVEAARNIRLVKDMEATIASRLAIFQVVYNNYLARFTPSVRYTLPPFQGFRPHPDVNRLIEADKDTVITTEDFLPVIDSLEERINQYQVNRKKEILATIPGESNVNQTTDPLELGKNIFSFEIYNRYQDDIPLFLIGWSQVAVHTFIGRSNIELRPGVRVDGPLKIHYNEKLSQVSSKLISFLQLDPATATIAEVDQKDARFVCACETTERRRVVYSWRGVLLHAHKVDLWHEKRCDYRLASLEDTMGARRSSAAFSTSARVWSCNHCCHTLEAHRAETKSAIFRHLEEKHAILEPRSPDDYFLNERTRSRLEAPFTISEPLMAASNPGAKYQCLRCPLNLQSRQFVQGGVTSHLRDRHKISQPRQDVDFKVNPKIGP